jgi:hypothetical protein
VKYTNGTSTSDPTACICKAGYESTNDGVNCKLTCYGMPYSKNVRKSGKEECECQGGFHWDKHIQMCTSKTGSSHVGVAVGVGVGVPLGLALLGLIVYLWMKKNSNPAAPIIQPTATRAQPIATTTTTTTVTERVVPGGAGAKARYINPPLAGSAVAVVEGPAVPVRI